MKHLLVILAVASLALAGCSPNSADTDNTNDVNPPAGATDTDLGTDTGVQPVTTPVTGGTTTTM